MQFRTAFLLMAVFFAVSFSNAALAASTISCEADDANVRIYLKGVSQRVSVAIDAYRLEIPGKTIALSADTPADAISFGGALFDGQDQLRMKSAFGEAGIVFEAFLGNAGKDEDDSILWQGGYKITFVDEPDQPSIRGPISCIDGY